MYINYVVVATETPMQPMTVQPTAPRRASESEWQPAYNDTVEADSPPPGYNEALNAPRPHRGDTAEPTEV